MRDMLGGLIEVLAIANAAGIVIALLLQSVHAAVLFLAGFVIAIAVRAVLHALDGA